MLIKKNITHDCEHSVMSFRHGALMSILLFLLVLSGQFSLERLGGIDVEIRVLFFVLLIFLFFWQIKSYRFVNQSPYFLLMNFFLFFYILTSAYSPDASVALIKLIDLIILFVIFNLSYIFFQRIGNLSVFLWCLVVIGAIYSAVLLWTVGTVGLTHDGRGSIVIGGPNVVTRIVFFGLLASIYFILKFKQYIFFLLLPVYGFGLVASGSRGGMVAAAFVFILAVTIFMLRVGLRFVKNPMFRKPRFYMLASALGSGVLIFFTWERVSDVFERRFVNLVLNRLHYAGRDELYNSSFSLFLDSPLVGIGLSGYEPILNNYPHNIFLEILLDGGILLLMFFLIATTILVRGFLHKGLIGQILFYLCIYMLIVSSVSGGIYDFRYFFVFFAAFIHAIQPRVTWVERSNMAVVEPTVVNIRN